VIKKLWQAVSNIGVNPNSNNPETGNVILGNQVVFIITISIILLAASFLALGIYRAVFILSAVVFIFLAFTFLIYNGKHFEGRIAGITAQNIAIFTQAVFLGADTRIIDFLIIAALMPMVLFHFKQRKAIIFCVSQNLILYTVYHLILPQIQSCALPHDQQLIIYNFTIPLKFIMILLVMYVIIRKRTAEATIQEGMINELERVNSGLQQFAYVTSHDLKTPLRNISTYLQLLRRKNVLDEDSNDMVDRAVKSVKHLNQLITDIFLYTTTDFKNESAEVVDMNVLLNDMREDFKALLTETNTTLNIAANIPKIKVSQIQVTHVFSNLIANALKYNKSANPTINISYIPLAKGFVEFTVADNGIGIEEQYQEQIFEIFKRLHTQEEYEGTGIGLAICKKIIESYGGSIRVESQLGKGAKFIFTLPALTE